MDREPKHSDSSTLKLITLCRPLPLAGWLRRLQELQSFRALSLLRRPPGCFRVFNLALVSYTSARH